MGKNIRWLILFQFIFIFYTGSASANPSESLKAEFGIQSVALPGGKFLMGSPKTEEGHEKDEKQRRVKVKPFTVTDLITIGQWEQVTDKRAWLKDNDPFSTEDWVENERTQNFPMVCSWKDTQRFLNTLFSKTGIRGRLMTEEEAEYLMRVWGEDRVITQTAYPWGDSPHEAGRYAWFADNSNGLQRIRTKEPTSPGVYDAQGIVRIWTDTFFRTGKHPSRTTRGGSYLDDESHIRSAFRAGYQDQRYQTIGFRIVIIE